MSNRRGQNDAGSNYPRGGVGEHGMFGRLGEISGENSAGAFGVQKSLLAGLPVPAAIFVGVVNAVGGGILRDLLSREEPLVFRPGQFYLLTALAGAVTFVFCSVSLELTANTSAVASVALTFVFRLLTIIFNWRTAPVSSGALFAGEDEDRRPPPAPPVG